MTSLVIARHFVIVLRVLRELEQTQKCEGIPVSTMYNYKMMMENTSGPELVKSRHVFQVVDQLFWVSSFLQDALVLLVIQLDK